MITWLLDPPVWVIVILMIVGFGLLWLDRNRGRATAASTEQPTDAPKAEQGPFSIGPRVATSEQFAPPKVVLTPKQAQRRVDALIDLQSAIVRTRDNVVEKGLYLARLATDRTKKDQLANGLKELIATFRASNKDMAEHCGDTEFDRLALAQFIPTHEKDFGAFEGALMSFETATSLMWESPNQSQWTTFVLSRRGEFQTAAETYKEGIRRRLKALDRALHEAQQYVVAS